MPGTWSCDLARGDDAVAVGIHDGGGAVAQGGLSEDPADDRRAISGAPQRTFGGTGGVVTTAGIVFGITMLALLGSSVLSIAQIGSTIAVGLLLDTLVVRALVKPSVVALLGRWFWWPRAVARAVSRE